MKDHDSSNSDSTRLDPPAFKPHHDKEDPPVFEPQMTSDISTDAEMQWSPDQPARPKINWSRSILALLTVLCITIWGWLSFSSLEEHKKNASQELSSAAVKASTLTHKLESDFLSPAEQTVKQMQSLIQHNDGDLDRLKAFIESNQVSLKPMAFGVAYLPDAYREGQKFHAPFYKKLPSQEYKLIENVNYDYTRLAGPGESYDARWFVKGMENDGGWQEPYFGTAIKEWIAEFSLPIYKTNPETGAQEKVGLILADFSLEEVREMVHKLTLNNLAYGYLVSPHGIIVSHPARDLLGKPLVAAYTQEHSETENSKAMIHALQIADRVRAGENFIEEFRDETTGQTSLVLHRQVPQSHWSFGIVMPKDDIYALETSNKQSILFAVIALALAIIFSIAVIKFDQLTNDELPWLLSIITSIFAVLITALILALFWNENIKKSSNRLFSTAETLSARGITNEEVKLIPTGILVNDIDFPQPQIAAVGGIIWQKFALKDMREQNTVLASQDTPAGVIWPDAKLGSEKLVPLREYKTNDYFVKSWRFHIEVSLERNIDQFPFDLSEIKIRMRSHADTQALLVPDFESYDILIPEVKPGLHENIKLNYWTIQNSSFSVDTNKRQKYSGTQITDQNKMSEIMFRVQMARQSHVTLVSYFLPVCISAIMMFVVLMIPSDRSPGSVFSVLGYGGTIFFFVSLFHVGLRNAAGIDSFTYLESYYVMLHIIVMLVSINGFLLMRGTTPKWVQYRNNLISKLLYWPGITISTTMFTLAYFL